jgi:hypothetical protein
VTDRAGDVRRAMDDVIMGEAQDAVAEQREAVRLRAVAGEGAAVAMVRRRRAKTRMRGVGSTSARVETSTRP